MKAALGCEYKCIFSSEAIALVAVETRALAAEVTTVWPVRTAVESPPPMTLTGGGGRGRGRGGGGEGGRKIRGGGGRRRREGGGEGGGGRRRGGGREADRERAKVWTPLGSDRQTDGRTDRRTNRRTGEINVIGWGVFNHNCWVELQANNTFCPFSSIHSSLPSSFPSPSLLPVLLITH